MPDNNKNTNTMFFYLKMSLIFIFAGASVIAGITVISQSGIKLKEELRDRQIPSSDSDREINNLTVILKDKSMKEKSPQTLVEAIKRLGSIKSAKAVPELLEYLDFEAPLKTTENYKEPSDGIEITPSIPLSGRYPAISALIQIGQTTLPKLIEVIENEESSSLKSKNALYTVQQIFRDDLSEAVKYLEIAEINSTSQKGKQRLSSAVTKIKITQR